MKLVSYFRPISLIGCQYEIVGKILANRIALVIDSIVSSEQYAFIKGRQILDGPLILNEVFSWCKAHKHQAIVFTVKFKKVYNSVWWNFLDDIMCRFHFGAKWRRSIRGCLISLMVSILVNGVPTLEFKIY